MLDDRLEYAVDAPGGRGARLHSIRAQGMWLPYLGESYDRSTTSPYAAPGRADDSLLCAGLRADQRPRSVTRRRHQYALRLPPQGFRSRCAMGPAPSRRAAAEPAAAARANRAYNAALHEALHPAG